MNLEGSWRIWEVRGVGGKGGKARNGVNEEPMYEVLKKIK